MSYHSWPAGGGGSGGSAFWGDSVPNSGALPASGAVIGEIRQALDTKSLWRWDGSSWSIYLDIPTEIAALSGIAGNIQDQIDLITVDVSTIDSDLTQAEADIDALEAYDITLDTRLDTIEGQNLDTRLTAAEGDIVTLDGRLDAYDAQNLDTRLAGAESDIDILEAYDITLTGRVTALEGDRVLKAGDTMTGPLILSGDPSSGLQAATKQYVDNMGNGQQWKLAVRLATTVDLGNPPSDNSFVDGFVAQIGDRILVKNQANPAQNGIYVCSLGPWARASDADAYQELNSASVMVLEGTANGDKGFYQTAELTSLSSNQTWIQNFGSGLYAADEVGITLIGKIFYLNGINALNSITPGQAGNSGKTLKTNGTTVSWQYDIATLIPTPITASGTIAANTRNNVTLPGAPITLTLPPYPTGSAAPISWLINDAARTASETNYIRIQPASGERLASHLAIDEPLDLDAVGMWAAGGASVGATNWGLQLQATTLAPPPGMFPGVPTGTTIPASYLDETISANIVANVSTVAASTFVDAGGTLSLAPGNWEIVVDITAYSVWTTGQTAGQIAVRDSANNVIKKYNFTPCVTAGSPTAVQPVSFTIPLNISVATTYKLSVQANNSNAIGAIGISGNGQSPVGGLATDSYWYAKRRS